MEELNVVIIGLGSMGKRRARIVRRLYPGFHVAGIDIQEERRKTFAEEFSVPVFASLADALAKIPLDASIISTSPLSHGDIAHECLSAGLHVFTELNLQPYRYEENMQLAQSKNLRLFLSSTFLYRKEIQYTIRKAVMTEYPLSYLYHVGQYLPDWHPWEDYRNYFVAKRESNACRELFAIELPWLTSAFGAIEEVHVVSSKMTQLELPYHDNYMVTIHHQGGCKGVLTVDVVSREAVRDLCVYGENLFIQWDGTPAGLKEKNLDTKDLVSVELYGSEAVRHDDNYSRNVIENAYENEIEAYVACITRDEKPVYGYKEDLKILSWIDEIEGIK
ncbi:Gfo/Idh/MocA family oxidoreductase [Selenomonas sp. AB3002]|uniref:Gfo/Idh/MocA family protein n=1 Tax=Selenomonas sp. AB3002 TaxID=1392502 RepID=UPI000A9E7D15